ncbi:hypothetical protein PACTADRAFT_2925 [Pachysolen tannophilus NRRL Y-2460]|uniref:Major facilitator superfamily (MFS) profile domain-containing protein n=1 Tax=Pachysolen tannophilus NRRL Y-2460 TaxID=669874 RepID=A0A1E4TU03_PACTA|nr:hypothetical protein PACTADRAFT_2925 [Pachysolen tannophilus NRRL Y-2460]
MFPKTYNVLAVTLIITLGGIYLNADSLKLPSFLELRQFRTANNHAIYKLEEFMSITNQIGALGTYYLTGSLISIILLDLIGRVSSFQVSSLFWISLVGIYSTNIWMLISGRLIKGVANGVFSCSLSVYVFEVIPYSKKGLILSVVQWSCAWGILLKYLINYGSILITKNFSFRLSWALEMLPSIFLLILAFFLPESPKFLAATSRWGDAAKVLERIRDNVPESTGYARRQQQQEQQEQQQDAQQEQQFKLKARFEGNKSATSFNQLKGTVEKVLEEYNQSTANSSFLDLFSKKLYKNTLVGVGTAFIVQIINFNLHLFYLGYFYEVLNISDDHTGLFDMSIQYCINIIFTIFPILLLDGIRRKDTIVFGIFILGICHFCIGLMISILNNKQLMISNEDMEGTNPSSSFILAFSFLFVAVFASTVSTTGWIYSIEIFPSSLRTKGTALVLSVSWFTNGLISFSTPFLLKFLNWGFFILLAILCLISCCIILIFFPETFLLNDFEIKFIFDKDNLNLNQFDEKKSDVITLEKSEKLLQEPKKLKES